MSKRAEWSAAPFVPRSRRLEVLAVGAQKCTGCPLFEDTTQAVFGEGPRDASLVLVGEQPGDQEDRKGAPFVGPAGGVLWRCIEEAGIDPDTLYVTNAVKHFKHETRGKRRLHKKPTTAEALACRPWLEAELEAVRGIVVVALGAVAAGSLVGKPVTIAHSERQPFEVGARMVFVTYHPSAVLRAQDGKAAIRARIVSDLQFASEQARRISQI